jgi:hypothetical protein
VFDEVANGRIKPQAGGDAELDNGPAPAVTNAML